MQKRKLIFIFFILIICVAFFAGCSTSKQESKKDEGGYSTTQDTNVPLIKDLSVQLDDSKSSFIVVGLKKEFKKGSNLEIPAKCSEKINNVTYKDLPIKKIADKAFQNV